MPRAVSVKLADDSANTGRAHRGLQGPGLAASFVPFVADHKEPGALSGEFYLRQTWAAITTARAVVLVNPLGSGVDLFLNMAAWEFYVATAQAVATWYARLYSGVGNLGLNDIEQSATGCILAGRGESRQRKAQVYIAAAATLAAPAVLMKEIPFFRRALAAGNSSESLFEGVPQSIWIPENAAVALELRQGAAANQFDAMLNLAWQEFVP